MNKILPIILVVVLFFPELSFAVPYERDAWEPRSGGGGSSFILNVLFSIVAFFVILYWVCDSILSDKPKQTITETANIKKQSRTSFSTNQSSDVVTIIIIIGIAAYFFLFK